MVTNIRWFLTSIILYGAYALFAQVLLLREFLVVFYGNEICLGLIFCCWLFWIAVGAWGARKIARLLDPERSLRIWIVSLTLLPLFLPVQVFSIRILRGILNIQAGEWIPFFTMSLSVLVILLPVSFIIGFSFPAACRVFPGKGTGAISIGRVYIYEATGALLGGLLLTFFLIDRLNPFSISSLGGLVLALSALLITGGLSGRKRHALAALILFVLASQMSLLSYAPSLHDYSVKKRWENFRRLEELQVSVDSRFQNIAIGLSQGQYSIYGNGLWAYSFPDEYSFATLAHLVLSEHPQPRSVLMIGGGEGGLIREVLKHSVTHLDYVELDPALIRTVEPFLPYKDQQVLQDPRVALHFLDGRYFVKQTDRHYDCVLINLPDPDTAMLNRYYTLDFFEEIKTTLNPGGMVFLSLTSTGNFAGEDVVSYGRSVYRTLKAAFPYIVVAPGTAQSFFASSSPDIVTSDPEVLSRRYMERGIESEIFSHYLFEQIFPEERVQALEAVLQKEGAERLNTDLYPITYFYNLILWGRYSGSTFADLLGLLTRFLGYWLFSPLLVLLFIYVGFQAKRSVTSPALYAISSTGFYGLSMEIILLFLFQNLYGYVYQKIGLIVALFMLGLALGGTAANGILKRGGGRVLSYMRWSDGVILSLAVITPWLPVLSRIVLVPVDLILYAVTIVIGGTAGFQFPMVSALCIGDGMDQAKTAAAIDNRDHLGACIGALLTGVLLVPLLGIAGTCYFIAGVKGISMVGLLLKR